MISAKQHILWRTSAILFGISLPTIMFGRTVMFVTLILGIIFGLMATHGASLRGTVRIFKQSKVVWLTVLMFVAFAASSAFGINPANSFDKLWQLVFVGFIVVLLFMALREMPGRYISLLIHALVGATCVALIVSLFDAFLEYERLSTFLHGTEKSLSTHRLNKMSGVFAILLPFSWVWFVRKTQQKEPFALLTALPVILIGLSTVVICGGRAGWVALFFSVILFLVLSDRWHGIVLHTRHWVLGFLAGVVGVVGYGFSRGWDQMLVRLEITSGERGLGGGRADIWQTSWNHILDNPLTGIGIQNFRYLPEKIDLHPHNFILQLLLETGFIGTAITLALFGYVFYAFIGYARYNLNGLAALCSLTAFFIVALFSTSIFNIWWVVFMVFIMVLGWRVGWAHKRQPAAGKIVQTLPLEETF